MDQLFYATLAKTDCSRMAIFNRFSSTIKCANRNTVLYEGHYLNVLQHYGGGDLSLRHIMGNTDAPLSALLLSSQQCYSGMTMASSMYW